MVGQKQWSIDFGYKLSVNLLILFKVIVEYFANILHDVFWKCRLTLGHTYMSNQENIYLKTNAYFFKDITSVLPNMRSLKIILISFKTYQYYSNVGTENSLFREFLWLIHFVIFWSLLLSTLRMHSENDIWFVHD